MEIRSAFYNFVKPDVSNWYPHFLEISQQKEHLYKRDFSVPILSCNDNCNHKNLNDIEYFTTEWKCLRVPLPLLK